MVPLLVCEDLVGKTTSDEMDHDGRKFSVGVGVALVTLVNADYAGQCWLFR